MGTGGIRVPGQAAQLQELRRWLRTWLENQQVPATLHPLIVLAAHEAAAVEIVYAGPEEELELRATLDGSLVTIDLTGGTGWLEKQAQAESGRRLAFIRLLVDEMVVLPNTSRATIRLFREVASDDPLASSVKH